MLQLAKSNYIQNRVIMIAIILLLSLLSVNRYGPDYLNADIILKSIMSLQNVTMFYWGQDRLLNVLPLLLVMVKNPAVNLFLVMFLTAVFYYLLLWHLSFSVLFAVSGSDEPDDADIIVVFLLFVGASLLLFREYTMFNMTIWLDQFTLSYCLLGIVNLMYLRQKQFDLTDKALIFLLLFMATGLNNSIIVPTVFLMVVYCIKGRHKLDQAKVVCASALLSFFMLAVFAKLHPQSNDSYFALDLLRTGTNLKATGSVLMGALNQPVLIGFALLIFIASIYLVMKKNGRLLQVYSALGVFAIGWFLVFANNQWVILNIYHFRYFFPVLIVLLLLVIISIWIILQNVAGFTLKRRIISIVLLVAIILVLIAPISKLDSYKIFNNAARLRAITSYEEVTFHNGDYWKAWPAVFFDLMNGKNSYGLAYRAEGNQDNLLAAVKEKLKRDGQLFVYCHCSDAEDYSQQVYNRVGNLELVSRENVIDGVDLLVFDSLISTTVD